MGERASIVRCRYLTPREGLQCTAEAVDPDAEVVLCARHLAAAARIYRDAARTNAELASARARPGEPAESGSIVYYIRRAEVIKIGTTVNPRRRFTSLMPDEILAFEPGGPKEEAMRHRQFHWCRVSMKSEYFRVTKGLLDHIASLRAQHGPPDPSWSSVTNLGTGYARTKQKVQLPQPVTGEMATATEGAKLLGFHVSTVSQWVRRELIKSVGENDVGRPLYYVEHMQFLIARSRTWMNRRNQEASAEPLA